MKHPRHLLIPAICVIASLTAAEPMAKENSAYEQAVKSYLTAATNEVQALRTQTDAICKDATSGTKSRYAGVYAKLEQCEKLLAELRKATPQDFDAIKTQYERERAELAKARTEADKSR